jgi:ribonuclease HII
MYPENKLNLSEYTQILATDEVGRGPLAGPVIVCAISIDLDQKCNLKKLLGKLKNIGVNDSKKLSRLKRKEILHSLGIENEKIQNNKIYELEVLDVEIKYCVTEVTHQKIDEINILAASLLGMNCACMKLLNSNKVIALIDGNKKFPDPLNMIEQVTVVGGDQKSPLIGLASIIAKEVRDYKMSEYAKIYPNYGFDKHAGYGTEIHRNAIKKFGPTPIHRKSFAGVKEYLS